MELIFEPKLYSQLILVFKTPPLRSCYLNRSVNYIIENLKSTLEKLDLSSTEVDLVKLYELKTMEKLIALDFLDYKHIEGMEELRKRLPNIHIGQYQFGIRNIKVIASGRIGYSPNYRD